MITLKEYAKRGDFSEPEITASYHNHNYLCRHGFGTVREYVQKAKEKGLKIFGVSDHGYVDQIGGRMSLNEFYNTYLPQFEETRDLGIKVLKGLEVEYFRENDRLYQQYAKHLDYLILGQHVFPSQGEIHNVWLGTMNDTDFVDYKNSCIEALKTGYFKFIAHPDIIFARCKEISEAGLQALEELVSFCTEQGYIMEVNANGLRRTDRYSYPRQEYIDLLKKYNTKVVVSDDAHCVENIVDEKTKACYAYLKEMGFNLLEQLDD